MTSHFLSSRWGHSLRAICSFVDVRAFICRLLGCGHLLFLWWLRASGSKSGLAVYVYLRFCCGALIRSSAPSSVWLASGLQSKAYFARACLGCSPSS